MMETRCHVCGAVFGAIDHIFFGETCSPECHDIYYTNPDEVSNDHPTR